MILKIEKNGSRRSPRKKLHPALPENGPHFVSVIIACYNDERGIKETLKSLSEQTYPTHLWEIIVVNNNSLDRTEETAKSFQHKFKNCVITNEPRQSSYAARNKGIRKSKGDILLFLDSDMTVEIEWISICVNELTKLNVGYVGGKVNVFSHNKRPNIFEKYDILTGFPIRNNVAKWNFAGAGCLIITRHLIDEVGMFDPGLTSGGDFEFGNRVKEHGFDQSYSDLIVFKHPARSSLKAHIKKAIRVSHGVADLKIMYPHRFGKLTVITVIESFIPILKRRIKPSNINIPLHTEISVFIISNVLNYVKAFALVLRYLRSRATF